MTLSASEILFQSLHIPGVGHGFIRRFAMKFGCTLEEAPLTFFRENPVTISLRMGKNLEIVHHVKERLGALMLERADQNNKTLAEWQAEAILHIDQRRYRYASNIIQSLELPSISEEQYSKLIASTGDGSIGFISGPAGTGKTHIIKAVYEELISRGAKVGICAPTGKAAANLTEKGIQASTIHRLFNYTPFVGWKRTQENPLPIDCLLVDESSMINAELFCRIFEGLFPATLVLFFGDSGQLPPVGEEQGIFHSYCEPNKALTTIHRQIESDLLRVIQSQRDWGNIARGLAECTGDGTVQQGKALHKLPSTISLCRDEILDGHITILCSYNVGRYGANNLNAIVRHQLSLDQRDVRTGERVIQLENNYFIHEEGVFNGESGVIVDEKAGVTTIKFSGDRLIDYPRSLQNEFSFGYALSIHKSQGSEYEEVWLVIDPDMPKPDKRSLYTALTRAKRRLIIFGEL